MEARLVPTVAMHVQYGSGSCMHSVAITQRLYRSALLKPSEPNKTKSKNFGLGETKGESKVAPRGAKATKTQQIQSFLNEHI